MQEVALHLFFPCLLLDDFVLLPCHENPLEEPGFQQKASEETVSKIEMKTVSAIRRACLFLLAMSVKKLPHSTMMLYIEIQPL